MLEVASMSHAELSCKVAPQAKNLLSVAKSCLLGEAPLSSIAHTSGLDEDLYFGFQLPRWEIFSELQLWAIPCLDPLIHQTKFHCPVLLSFAWV